MRVFHLINTLAPGGAEGLVRDLVGHTDASDVSFTVGHLWGEDTLASEIESAGARVQGFGADFRYSPLLVRKVARQLSRVDVDVLHAHLPVSHAIGRVAGRITGVDRIVTTQHNVPDNYGLVSGSLERLTRPLDDATVTISYGVREAWGDPEWHVVYNGIDVAGLEERIRAADPEPVRELAGDPGLLLLSVGRYVPEKRQHDLIAMMGSVVEVVPDAHLLLVGWGELEDDLRDDVTERGLDGAVTVTGRVPSVAAYYAAADVFISALDYEGMGIVHFEAMAAGLPIVSTDIPDMREVVDDGTTGLLVPPGDPRVLARAVVRLDDDERRREFGDAGRDRVRQRFSIGRTAAQYLDLYRSLLEGA